MPKRPERNENVYIGIDPGKAGGIAVIDSETVTLYKMPPTEHGVVTLFESFKAYRKKHALIEKVGSVPGNSARSMFTFGRGVGVLHATLISTRIPFEEIIPTGWMRGLSIRRKRKTETKPQWKQHLKSVAEKMFPEEKLTLATCDALLIAEFCRRQRTGTLR